MTSARDGPRPDPSHLRLEFDPDRLRKLERAGMNVEVLLQLAARFPLLARTALIDAINSGGSFGIVPHEQSDAESRDLINRLWKSS